IVTADSHGDFGSTPRLAANVLPYSFRIGHVSHPIRRLHDLAECCVFVKQSVDPFHCDRLHFELCSKWEASITKFQAPENLQSLKLQTSFGEAALCLDFGAWDLEFAP